MAPFVDPKAVKMKFTNRFHVFAAFAATLMLASCGGGDGAGGADATAPPPPPQAVPALQMVGAPVDANAVNAPVCATPYAVATVGPAATVRYPASTGSFRGWPSPSGDAVVYGSPIQVRTDRAGGFVVSHNTDANGAMFRVAANGDKSVLPIPYGPTFDVAADGTVWFVRNGSLFVATQNGTIANVATLGNSAAAVDGPLGSAPLGPVTLIAAGKDKVYLLVEEATPNVTDTPSPVAFKRSLRELSRSTQISGGWVVKTLPLWAGLQTVDVISSIRVSATDQLVVLVNEPFKGLLSQQQIFPGGIAYQYGAETWVGVLDSANNWTEIARKAYVLDVVPNATHGYRTFNYWLDAKDLAVAPNGDIWVGGAGAIFKVDRAGGWQPAASAVQHPSDQVGRDGKLAEATFASASQLVADNAGITFYDGETCQIRRLANENIATLSGPQLGGPHFTAARFVGQDTQGDLLLAYGNSGGPGNVDLIRGLYLNQFALVRAPIATPSFVLLAVKSLATALGGARCSIGTSYWAGPATCTGQSPAAGAGPGIWLGIGTRGVLARIGNDLMSGLDRGDGTTFSSTTSWPGILNGDAPSGPSGIHVNGSKLYLFGWMRTDPPVALNRYHELRLYELDTATSAGTVVAGASIGSTAFNGMKLDLSPVIPAAGGGPAFVQHRSDGKFWLSNGKEIWLLDAAGQLKRIAGLSISGGGVDGVGDTASFALISSMRVLPDNRLLVVDMGAHAVRLLADDGKVTTFVGKLNTPGTIFGPLPAGLNAPVDAFAVGKDVYITTQTSRNLLLAKSAL